MDDLLTIEQWECYDRAGMAVQASAQHDYYACSHCRKIRPTIHFLNSMVKGARGKWSGGIQAAQNRHCIDCWLDCNGRAANRNVEISYGGDHCGRGFVCARCGRFNDCWWPSSNPPPGPAWPQRANWKCVPCGGAQEVAALRSEKEALNPPPRHLDNQNRSGVWCFRQRSSN